MRIKISRKEAKESALWLRLIKYDGIKDRDKEKDILIQEANELTKIFSAIVEKTK